MISKDCNLHLSYRGLHRLHLMQNIDAIAVIDNHLRDFPNLTLDPQIFSLCFIRVMKVDVCHSSEHTASFSKDVKSGER
jgi:hypothetical protein